jgi:quercetin dioxygenase-like cupin family protein
MSEGNRRPDPPVRRIVTGHDRAGRAVVVADGPAANHKWSGGGRTVSTLVWSSFETPAEIWTGEDFGARIIEGSQPPPMGSRFCVIEFAPRSPGRMHRTDTVDYVMAMQGRIDMEMDDSAVTLSAGDVLVQQGTNHSWVNRYDAPARLAFVLIDAGRPPGGSLAIADPLPPTPQRAAPPPPDLAVRRVVTSHDETGRAVAMWDGPQGWWTRRAPGNGSSLIWSTDGTPAGIRTRTDCGARPGDIQPPPRGSWFRVIDYPPGLPGRMHRTDTLDYAVCLGGEMRIDLDDSSVRFRAGDVMVQQGTNHSWVNDGDRPARIAFVLMDGKRRP